MRGPASAELWAERRELQPPATGAMTPPCRRQRSARFVGRAIRAQQPDAPTSRVHDLLQERLVDVALPRRIDAGEPRNQDRDEKRTGDLLDHADAARLARERRDVAESGTRENGYAQVERVGEHEPSWLADDHERLGIEIADDRIVVSP